LAQIFQIAAAGVFGGKFYLVGLCAAVADHFADLGEGGFAGHAQLVFQVQIGRGQDNMKARMGSRLERAEKLVIEGDRLIAQQKELIGELCRSR